jgi:hypothetical protein
MIVDKITGHAIGNRPALIGGVLLVLVGLQFASLGLLAELIVYRTRGQLTTRPAVTSSGGAEMVTPER